jgi:hypothetical protein
VGQRGDWGGEREETERWALRRKKDSGYDWAKAEFPQSDSTMLLIPSYPLFFSVLFFNLVAFSTLFPSFPSSLPIHGPLCPGQPVNGRHRSPGALSLRPDPVLLRANLFGPFPPSNLSFFSPFHGSDKDSVGYQVGNLL